jgi:hypothetical protein
MDETSGQYTLVLTAEDAKQCIKAITDNGDIHALDFETTGLRPEGARVRLTCISGPAGNFVESVLLNATLSRLRKPVLGQSLTLALREGGLTLQLVAQT